jgi:hypothetical protein
MYGIKIDRFVEENYRQLYELVKFQVLTAASVKIAVFWIVAPCSLVEVCRRFRGVCCLIRPITVVMEAADTSETSVNFYRTTRRNNPEDSHL